jgi:hypothetical protein
VKGMEVVIFCYTGYIDFQKNQLSIFEKVSLLCTFCLLVFHMRYLFTRGHVATSRKVASLSPG